MKNIVLIIFCLLTLQLFASDKLVEPKQNMSDGASDYSMDCAQATAQADLDVNNVRATLLVGGDIWWNGNEGRYIVPQVEPGEEEVSSIFAAGIWMGGIDAFGNLKIAAQSYGTARGASDYWPGPILEEGLTDAETCANWDKIFTVKSEEIELHINQYQEANKNGLTIDPALIPQSLKEWPGIGNEFFFDIFGFELPSGEQGLAPFWDQNGDGVYTPQFGDYPIIEKRGCSAPIFADQISYWIFNDVGNIHSESNADALGMEIQAQAFAFNTDDQIKDHNSRTASYEPLPSLCPLCFPERA